MGRQRYPNARELTVTADCGVRDWTGTDFAGLIFLSSCAVIGAAMMSLETAPTSFAPRNFLLNHRR
jgi:hypothetical protein